MESTQTLEIVVVQPAGAARQTNICPWLMEEPSGS